MINRQHRLDRLIKKYNLSEEEANARVNHLDQLYAQAEIRKQQILDENSNKTIFKGNQEITNKLDEITYSIISDKEDIKFSPVGNGLYEKRMSKQVIETIQFKYNKIMRRWEEIKRIIVPK